MINPMTMYAIASAVSSIAGGLTRPDQPSVPGLGAAPKLPGYYRRGAKYLSQVAQGQRRDEFRFPDLQQLISQSRQRGERLSLDLLDRVNKQSRWAGLGPNPQRAVQAAQQNILAQSGLNWSQIAMAEKLRDFERGIRPQLLAMQQIPQLGQVALGQRQMQQNRDMARFSALMGGNQWGANRDQDLSNQLTGLGTTLGGQAMSTYENKDMMDKYEQLLDAQIKKLTA